MKTEPPIRPKRQVFCRCTIAQVLRGVSSRKCPMHGANDLALAYRAGMQDAANGYSAAQELPMDTV